MNKRFLVCLLMIISTLLFSGCWNYKGLDQMDIVFGIAVDFDKEAGRFDIAYEAADLAGAGKDVGIKGRIIQSQGKTLLDAARNAKRKEADKLFFGSTNVLIISQELAQEIGIRPVINWFLRDGECRETLNVVLSQENTAESILQRSEQMSGIVSLNLHDILREDSGVTASSLNIKLYELYNQLSSVRNAAILPALRKVENSNQQVAELNGVAILKGDKLTGFLTPEESKYLLFLENRIKGGVLTLSLDDKKFDDISLEIFRNKTKKSFTHDQGKITVKIATKTRVSVDESQLDMMDQEVIRQITEAAENMLETNIHNLISKMQHEFQIDIFGFNEMIYKKDLKLWRQLEPSWEKIFPTLEIEVDSEIIIRDSAFIK